MCPDTVAGGGRTRRYRRWVASMPSIRFAFRNQFADASFRRAPHCQIARDALRFDTTELAGMDVLSSPTGAIAEAQRLASEAVGADRTWFLVNGSTVGLHAALLAHASPGATVAISRDCHQSVHAALVLSGARPLWVAPEHDTRFDVAWPSARRFEAAIAPAEGRPNPHLAAALVTSPNYFGVCANVSRIAAACTRAGSASPLPLIVDEAHGAHLPFLREGTDPPDALSAGVAVAVQSTHKTLGAMTQAAMVHARADRGARCDAIDAALAVLQTSSPSYILMASLQ